MSSYSNFVGWIELKYQHYRIDEVVYELGPNSFMTQSGIVIEGNFRIGDKVPVIFDLGSLRYLPMFKKEEHEPDVHAPELDEGEEIRYPIGCMVQWVEEEKKIFFQVKLGNAWGLPNMYIDVASQTAEIYQWQNFAYAMNVVEFNPRMGALLYRVGDLWKIFKFRVTDEPYADEYIFEGKTYKKYHFVYSYDEITLYENTSDYPLLPIENHAIAENTRYIVSSGPNIISGNVMVWPKGFVVYMTDPTSNDLDKMKWAIFGAVAVSYRVYYIFYTYSEPSHQWYSESRFTDASGFFGCWAKSGMQHWNGGLNINDFSSFAMSTELSLLKVGNIQIETYEDPIHGLNRYFSKYERGYVPAGAWAIFNDYGTDILGWFVGVFTAYHEGVGEGAITKIRGWVYDTLNGKRKMVGEGDWAYSYGWYGVGLYGDGFRSRMMGGFFCPDTYVLNNLYVYEIDGTIYGYGDEIPEEVMGMGFFPFGRSAKELLVAQKTRGLLEFPVIQTNPQVSSDGDPHYPGTGKVRWWHNIDIHGRMWGEDDMDGKSIWRSDSYMYFFPCSYAAPAVRLAMFGVL